MKITDIKTIPIQMPLPKTFRGSHYFMTHRCTIITRIYTDEGIIGECYNGDEYETQAEVIKIIHEEIKPKVIGMEIASTEKIGEAMLGPTARKRVGKEKKMPASVENGGRRRNKK